MRMKKLCIIILCQTIALGATGNFMVQNHGQEPVIVVLHGLGQTNKCFATMPQPRSSFSPNSATDPLSFDSHYQNLNGKVDFYYQKDFGKKNLRQALRICNQRDYLKKKPFHTINVDFASPHSSENIIVTLPIPKGKK